MSDAPTPQTPTDSSREAGDELGATYLDGEITTTPGRRVSANKRLIVIEAQLVADGKNLDNPAVPAEGIMADVIDTLEQKRLPKAWKACRGGRDD
jgi:hypothetical protein